MEQSVLMEMPKYLPPSFIIETVTETIIECFEVSEMSINIRLFEEKEDSNVFEISSPHGPKAFVYAGITMGSIMAQYNHMYENETDTAANG
jgi:hypothetical protein